ncbi:cadherin-related protein [Elysia marginata]|uniref:Cadherin-related protein n=1 Tax=Elysia marginata TaxID=1093978 RepID=A0AAV4HV22_9GAST|nr:cadherin-related protein [Elysia marginata]
MKDRSAPHDSVSDNAVIDDDGQDGFKIISILLSKASFAGFRVREGGRGEEKGVRDTAIKRGNLCSKSALRAPTDDHQSDTSGETTTSDSGRGGSEEDIQLPPLPELHEDTSRIIFKNTGAGLKSSRFVQSSYPDRDGRETIAFETFSPRTLPMSGYGGDGSRYRHAPDLQTFHNKDFQTIGHNPSKYHQQRRHPGMEGGGGAFKNTVYSPKSPTHSLPAKTICDYQTSSSPQRPYQGGPGFYPDDIPERLDTAPGAGPLNKKSVTFHTDLTTQNLKTWDLCQKMEQGSGKDFLSASPSRDGGAYGSQHYVSHPSPQSGYHVTGKGSYGGRPRSQDDDDNTTTSGSYTINPENDFDDTLPPPFSSMA